MIRLSEIAEVGRFNKPHGIKGEISVSINADIDLDDVKCVIAPIDGIFVPFFLQTARPKTADTSLITIDGIDSEEKAQGLTNRPLFILRSDLPDDEDDNDEDGFYASDLIGFKINDMTHGTIGEISDINDSTQNILFIVKTPDGKELMIPVADEFILSIDPGNETVNTDIPSDILTLND